MSDTERIETAHLLNYINKIVTAQMDGKVTDIKRFSAGYSGIVFSLDVTKNEQVKKVVLKLNDEYRGRDRIEDETFHDRIYAANYRSFEKVYELVRNRGILTYDLLASARPTAEIPFFYHLMSLLEGESIREYLTNPKAVDVDSMYGVAGREFAQLHTITRNFDGWAGQERPYTQDWRSAFLQSLQSKWEDVDELPNQFVSEISPAAKEYMKKVGDRLDTPDQFVLSHIDGLQAVAEHVGNEWQFRGHIDLEDYAFTDQRFVLAGFELAVAFDHDLVVPQTFWDGYNSVRGVDPSYDEFKDLFKLYYLLSWFPMVYEKNWRGNPEDRDRVIGTFEKLLGNILI